MTISELNTSGHYMTTLCKRLAACLHVEYMQVVEGKTKQFEHITQLSMSTKAKVSRRVYPVLSLSLS